MIGIKAKDILLNKCVQYNIILKGIMVEIATKIVKIVQNRQKRTKSGKKSWERGSERPILNLKCYLLKFYQKKNHIFNLFESLVVFRFL